MKVFKQGQTVNNTPVWLTLKCHSVCHRVMFHLCALQLQVLKKKSCLLIVLQITIYSTYYFESQGEFFKL